MEKIKRTKEVYKKVTEEEIRFIARDGEDFGNEEDCLSYEKVLDRIEELRAGYLGRPLDCDLNEDYWGFDWFRVRDQEDVRALETYYRANFSGEPCREAVSDGLVCVANPTDTTFDEPLLFTVTEMIRTVTNFMSEAGYEVKIDKKTGQ